MAQSKTQKTTNNVIATAAIGLGAYALWKAFSKPSSEDAANGEGAIGGSEDMFGEEQGFPAWIDPNTIPDQPTEEIPYFYPVAPTEPTEPSINPSSPDADSRSSASDFFTPVPDNSTPTTADSGGIFGTGISTAEGALGLAGLFPSYATSLGKNLFSTGQEGAESLLKRTAKEAVEDTPFVGKQLKDFAFKQTDEVAISTSEAILKSSAGEIAEGTVKTVGGEIVESGAKGLLKGAAKEAGGLAVKSIPIVGVAAGAEFDVLVDDRPRWIAYPANILGDVVGGALGVLTAPAAVTGVGAAVPVVASVGGQVATESLIYGAYDLFTGKAFQSSTEELAAAQKLASDAQNQGTIVPDFVKEKQPTIEFGNTFALSGANKNVVKLDDDEDIDLTRFKPDGSGGFFDTELKQSVSSNVAKSRSSSGSSRSSSSFSTYISPVSVIQSSIVKQSSVNTGSSSSGSSRASSSLSSASSVRSGGGSSSSRSTSSSIDTSRFKAQAGGGYSDTVALQSVSAAEAARRSSSSSNIFSVSNSSSSSSSSRSSSSSSSSKSSSSSSSSKSSSPSYSSSSRMSTSTPSFSSYVSSSKSSSSSSSSKTSSSSTAKSTASKSSSSSSSSTKKTSTVSKVVSKIRSWFKR